MLHGRTLAEIGEKMWGNKQTAFSKVKTGKIVYIPSEGNIDLSGYIDSYLKRKFDLGAIKPQKKVYIEEPWYYLFSDLLGW